MVPASSLSVLRCSIVIRATIHSTAHTHTQPQTRVRTHIHTRVHARNVGVNLNDMANLNSSVHNMTEWTLISFVTDCMLVINWSENSLRRRPRTGRTKNMESGKQTLRQLGKLCSTLFFGQMDFFDGPTDANTHTNTFIYHIKM